MTRIAPAGASRAPVSARRRRPAQDPIHSGTESGPHRARHDPPPSPPEAIDQLLAPEPAPDVPDETLRHGVESHLPRYQMEPRASSEEVRDGVRPAPGRSSDEDRIARFPDGHRHRSR